MPGYNFSAVNALVVDDYRFMRILLKEVLDEIGFQEVHTAGDGMAAAEILRANPIDVVFLDWHLPSARGEELVEAIRSQCPETCPRIVLIAGAGQESAIEEAARRSGADSWICRPFETDHLHARLAPLLTS